ncbi:MAG: hypothetical protein IPH53_18905 [Flavobacteriales bacterium]|nr:hypothetical protein [Flavobacteriales bacterium]
MKKLLPSAAFSLFALAGQAQLTITDSLTIGSITTLLEGIGVTVSNVTVNCPERAIGSFRRHLGIVHHRRARADHRGR